MAYAIASIRCAVVIVFAVSSLSKVHSSRAFHAFQDWLAAVYLPVVTGRPKAAAVAVVCSEVTTGALVAISPTARIGLVMAACIFVVFAAGVTWAVRKKIRVPCMCFGSSTAPLSIWHAVRNLSLCCIAGAGAAGFGPAVNRPGELVLGLGTGMTGAILIVFAEDLARFRGRAEPQGLLQPGEIRRDGTSSAIQ
jgi:uncharacterized membrane protein YphA (DoxX/SURF4 family)